MLKTRATWSWIPSSASTSPTGASTSFRYVPYFSLYACILCFFIAYSPWLQMEKTEKSMAELQVEKNLSYEFDKITEAGADLQPLSGQG